MEKALKALNVQPLSGRPACAPQAMGIASCLQSCKEECKAETRSGLEMHPLKAKACQALAPDKYGLAEEKQGFSQKPKAN